MFHPVLIILNFQSAAIALLFLTRSIISSFRHLSPTTQILTLELLTMSLTLTALAHNRPVTIDLTLSPDTPTPSQGIPSSNRSSQTLKQRRPRTWTHNDAPTPKRRNLGKGLPARNIKDCLIAQVVPVVRDATRSLPQSVFSVDAIGQRVSSVLAPTRTLLTAPQVIVELAKSRFFKLQVDETFGYLRQEHIQHLSDEAKSLVEAYRSDPVR